jgi:dTMP kinase
VRGLLITLEGIDGSGKSTAAKAMAASLKELMPGRILLLTAEPTTGEAGKILRKELSSCSEDQDETTTARRMRELFLFMADHADHLAKTVIPALEAGAIVISDRYADSTAAYQGVTLRGIVPDSVQWIRSLYRPWNVIPDKTLLFVLNPTEALERLGARSAREKFERNDFLKEVDMNFRLLASLEPERFVQIDAEQEEETVAKSALHAAIDLVGRGR